MKDHPRISGGLMTLLTSGAFALSASVPEIRHTILGFYAIVSAGTLIGTTDAVSGENFYICRLPFRLIAKYLDKREERWLY